MRMIGKPVVWACVGVMLVLVGSQAVFADEHKVVSPGTTPGPGEYYTIQAAITDASTGDTVLVADGTYTGIGNRDLSWSGKYLTIKSENGPTKSIIDCEGNPNYANRRAFKLVNQPGNKKFGQPDYSGDKILGFTIKEGYAHDEDANGAGIYLEDGSSPWIEDCIITGNISWDGNGGGIYCENGSNPFIWNCIISENHGMDGAGIHCSFSQPLIGNCSITGNHSWNNGGGISTWCSYPAIYESTISGNTAGSSGGGIAFVGTPAELPETYCVDKCMIFGNTAYGYGGGVYYDSSFDPDFEAYLNCIWRSTITKNLATYDGGGIFCENATWTGFFDCVIVNNFAWEDSSAGGGIGCASHCNIMIDFCTIGANQCSSQGGGGGIYAWHYCSLSVYNSIFWQNYGWPGTQWCLSDHSSLSSDYNWIKKNEQDAIVEGEDCQIVWGGHEVDTGDPYFSNPSGGNFRLGSNSACRDTGAEDPAGVNHDREMNDRKYGIATDIGAYEWPNPPRTIVVPPCTLSDASQSYGTIQRAINEATDGDTIKVVEGVYCGPENKNLTWTINRKQIKIRSYGIPEPENCIIDCEGDGRGFWFHNYETAETTIEGFTIRNGAGNNRGGGILLGHWNSNYPASPTIRDCIIENCEADTGGGICCCGNSNAQIESCLIKNNNANYYDGAGGILCEESSPTITNCTLAANTGGYSSAGGIDCSYSSSSPTVTNCILWNNGSEIQLNDATIAVTYSDVEGGYSGTGNINSDPRFLNEDAGKYYLAADSPCIDKATNSGAPTTDIEGNGRYDYPGMPSSGQVSTVDMGAYEAVPPLVWSTFLGGSSDDYGWGIAVDSAGCVYVTGATSSSGFPVQSGYDESHNGNWDVFVTKLNADGTDIIYSTFLGGSGNDNNFCILVNDAGEAYLTGDTGSSDFPTTSGAYDTSHNGSLDIFVSKLNASGNGLQFSTLIGGSSSDYSYGLALDGSGNVYVAGYSWSNNFPATSGSFHGYYDAIICKFDDDCSSRTYAMYLGGTSRDMANDIAVDSAGCAYVTGWTECSNFPTTSGAYDVSKGTGEDAFIVKLNSAGSSLAYSTFLGGDGHDHGNGMLVDSSGCAYVTGCVGYDATGMATSGAYQQTKGAYYDGFVAKLNSGGNGLEFFTYLGGNGSEGCFGIAIDSSGDILVAGQTSSTDLPATAGAYDVSYNGGNDVFVARLDSDCSDLEYLTYLGGNNNESSTLGNPLAIVASGCAYVVGHTASSGFPVTSGAYDQTHNGGYDAFVTKLSMVPSPAVYSVTVSSSPANSGSVSKSPDKEFYAYGEQVTLTPYPAGGYYFSYWGGDASGSQNPKTITITGDMDVTAYFTQTTYSLTTSVSPGGSGTVTKNPDYQSYPAGTRLTLTANAANGYTFNNWSGDISGSQNPKSITVNGNMSVTANFTQSEYTLTTSVSPSGAGSVSKDPDQAHYHYGDVVALTASPTSGYYFYYWSGSLGGSQNPKDITMTGNAAVTANFYQGGGGCR